LLVFQVLQLLGTLESLVAHRRKNGQFRRQRAQRHFEAHLIVAGCSAAVRDDFGAERALAMGFVNHVHPDQTSALAAAQALAGRIAANSPLAVTGTKRVLEYCADKSVEDGLTYVATWNAAFVASEDLREAMTAFFEKRPPSFRGC
jgi:enoyl-CoA hydratase/carnithine racemase